ncbi:hypothetical protein O181_001591 [Austropuccinia psidii MF-1]|uniref:Uncharacterized protein n=1 Tax=Austropuccinia psidii MF-1 TaxID=1389203 RepID=A0A9Q3GCJ7_9BASI|nr:hypothetical protein [Austropuccinia psidii MF-1]
MQKEKLELKEDIKSIMNNISLENELPRQSTLILDRNVLNLNSNDFNHHKISINAELETTFNLKEIPRLEEWSTFIGEVEYNNMEFIKTIDMFKEDLPIPDEIISAILHSLFNKLAKKLYFKMIQDNGKHTCPW